MIAQSENGSFEIHYAYVETEKGYSIPLIDLHDFYQHKESRVSFFSVYAGKLTKLVIKFKDNAVSHDGLINISIGHKRNPVVPRPRRQ